MFLFDRSFYFFTLTQGLLSNFSKLFPPHVIITFASPQKKSLQVF